ncbi:MAG TPA: anaerobic ribonucleoside-triphosphate reductase activating protein [Thermodesulfobacteriota bacterium]|jgi:pyruvate formate lyase activating enzyme|nr:anaerobic ribonucleoside-triphosphate reductase activating protein [Thermodesulfobacteriota bacterium]
MLIGGLQRSSLIDYPGMISAVVFTQGCNFRCPYCHNPELVYPDAYRIPIPENDVLLFLERRARLLDGVVISGGEALLQRDLRRFLKRIKAAGYPVKLDTNGSLPDVLSAVIRERLVDYIAMDIKAPFRKYEAVAGAQVDTDAVRESIRIIVESGVKYQFRTTKVNILLDDQDIEEIREYIGNEACHVVQPMNPYPGERHGGKKEQG